MCVRFIDVIECFHSLLLRNRIPLYGCTSLFIHPPITVHLGCFQEGKLWINLLWTWVSWFLWEHVFSFLPGRRLRMGLLDRTMSAAAAAATKPLQSCLTLCDPIDGSPPGSPVPGILQARALEWVAISFSNAWEWRVKVKSLSRAWLLVTPWTAA